MDQMKKKLAYFSLVTLVLTGCEPVVVNEVAVGEPAEVSTVTETTVSEENGAIKSSANVTVAEDAFTDIPQAIAVLTSATEQSEIAQALVWLGMQGEAAVEPLNAVLKDNSGQLSGKIYACRALGQIGSPASGALVEALSSDSGAVRINAAKQLGKIKPSSQAIVAALLKLVDHEDIQSRQHALKALTEIGPPAEDQATQRLIALLNDANESDIVRNEAKRALKSIAPRHTFKD